MSNFQELQSISARLAPHLRILRRVATQISDTIIPPVCLSCSQLLDRHNSLCASCWRDVRFISSSPVCDRLGLPLSFDPGDDVVVSAAALAKPPAYDRARAATHFSGTARDLMHRFKYGDQLTLRRLFTQWLMIAGRDIIAECGVIVPVPLHRSRLLTRRFNQAAVLAQDLAQQTGLEFCPDGLRRKRSTVPQVGLTRDQRRRNLQGAFMIPEESQTLFEGRTILLIDDVITTSTTIETCARILKRAGVARVNVIAVAMVTDDARVDI